MSATSDGILGEKLSALLAEPVASAEARERRTFAASQTGTDGTVVLFGAGRLGRLCARSLRRAGVPLRAFCDGNPALQGMIQEGAEVLSPAEAAQRFGSTALFVVAIWTGTARESMADRIAYLRKLGCAHAVAYPSLVWVHGTEETPFHSFTLPSRLLAHAGEFRKLASLMSDEESRRTLVTVLRQRLLGEFDARQPAADQYFPADLVALTDDEVVIDGGAFNGDTLQAFLLRIGARFCEYHAFEPDPTNAESLRLRIRGMPREVQARITVHQAALHSHETELSFTSESGPTSRLASGGSVQVRGVALDRILAGRPVTFLKLDIEGAEQDALQGAARLLTGQQPLAAVCVYHGPDDLWRIPLQLHTCMPRSRLFLRQHGFDGWETVCYAIPHERCHST